MDMNFANPIQFGAHGLPELLKEVGDRLKVLCCYVSRHDKISGTGMTLIGVEGRPGLSAKAGHVLTHPLEYFCAGLGNDPTVAFVEVNHDSFDEALDFVDKLHEELPQVKIICLYSSETHDTFRSMEHNGTIAGSVAFVGEGHVAMRSVLNQLLIFWEARNVQSSGVVAGG